MFSWYMYGIGTDRLEEVIKWTFSNVRISSVRSGEVSIFRENTVFVVIQCAEVN